jgi:hypothetical protein
MIRLSAMRPGLSHELGVGLYKMGLSRVGDYLTEFLASNETLQDINIGDLIKAKLREAPKCPEK